MERITSLISICMCVCVYVCVCLYVCVVCLRAKHERALTMRISPAVDVHDEIQGEEIWG